MKFTDRLKELRTEKQLTQKELAAALGVSSNCICEWEKGRSEPSIDTLKKMALILESTVDYLIGFTDDLGNVVSVGTREGQSKAERALFGDFIKLPEDLQRRAVQYVKKLKEISDFEKE